MSDGQFGLTSGSRGRGRGHSELLRHALFVARALVARARAPTYCSPAVQLSRCPAKAMAAARAAIRAAAKAAAARRELMEM